MSAGLQAYPESLRDDIPSSSSPHADPAGYGELGDPEVWRRNSEDDPLKDNKYPSGATKYKRDESVGRGESSDEQPHMGRSRVKITSKRPDERGRHRLSDPSRRDAEAAPSSPQRTKLAARNRNTFDPAPYRPSSTPHTEPYGSRSLDSDEGRGTWRADLPTRGVQASASQRQRRARDERQRTEVLSGESIRQPQAPPQHTRKASEGDVNHISDAVLNEAEVERRVALERWKSDTLREEERLASTLAEHLRLAVRASVQQARHGWRQYTSRDSDVVDGFLHKRRKETVDQCRKFFRERVGDIYNVYRDDSQHGLPSTEHKVQGSVKTTTLPDRISLTPKFELTVNGFSEGREGRPVYWQTIGPWQKFFQG